MGGVAHRGAPRPLDITGLRRAVRLQATAKELKREYLGKGDILRLLGMRKVETFLDWVAAEGLLVHYIALDPLYWALVDIIDSVISHDHLTHLQAYHWQLKNDLFIVLAADWVDTLESLGFLMHLSAFGVDADGRLNATAGSIRKAVTGTDESVACQKVARFLGKEFARVGDRSTIYSTLGVRP